MKKILVNRQDFNDKVNFIKDLIKDQNETVLITGVAGSGKSEFAKRVQGRGIDVVHLDEFGSKQENNWIIDVSKIPIRSRVFEGLSDNLQDVIKKIRPTAVFVVVAGPAELRKAYEERSRDRLNQFADQFKAKSELSDSAIAFEQKQFINRRF